ncbi:MAG: stage II sporulation protein P [Bacilli bacterium]
MNTKYKKIFKTIVKNIVIFLTIYMLLMIFYNKNFKNYIINNMFYNKTYYKINNLKFLALNKSYLKINNIKNNNDKVYIKKENKPLVYIYNTYQTLFYSAPFVYEYTLKPNVMISSYMLKEELNKYNINSVVEGNNIEAYLKDNGLKLSDSYKISRLFMENELQKNKELKYFFDIQRSSLSIADTLLINNNKKYARITFIIGKNNTKYKDNYEEAVKINDLLNKEVNDLARGITYKGGKYAQGVYNQDFNRNVLLLEIGGSENEIEEVNNSIIVLSKVLSTYIKENNGKH